MPIRDRFDRHRKDNRWVFGGLAVLLLGLSLVYYALQRSRELPSEIITNRLLLFVLWYINLVLILTILFVLLRNLLKLFVERRHRILGSKFKTKLIATYIGLSLLPGLLLFVYGTKLLQGWIDRWFDEPAVRQVVEEGYAVAEALNQRIVATQVRDSQQVLRELREVDLEDPAARPQLARRTQRLLKELELDFLAVFDGADFVHAELNPESGVREFPEPGRQFLAEALREGRAVRFQPSSGQGRLILSAVAGRNGDGDGDANSRPVVVAATLLDPVLASQSEQLIQAYQGFRQLEVRKGDIEAGYYLTFLMVTLSVLLATSWVGLLLARRITVPIQALAEGTRRVSEGDFDFQVEAETDDELGILIDSFNQMTSEIGRSNELLDESNRELTATATRLADERSVIGAVLQSVAGGVISVDQDGHILTCNGAALQMLRQTEDDVLGRAVGEAWDDPERSKLGRLFDEDPGPSGRLAEAVRLILGGEWKTFEAKVTTMRDHEGRISGRVMVLEETTELVRAQQMAAWSEAARRIAHEIKNPLTPIRLSMERLLHKHRQGDADLGEAIEEGAEIVGREVEGMKAMVDEFSRFARMPPPRPREIDLAKLAQETMSLYEGLKPGVEVTSEIAPGAEAAWLDDEQIKRVLINLLDNAVEATPAPGRVEVAARRSGSTLEITVSDTGPGIPPESKEKLFLPYFSTKGRGTGLGLSIVHRIVSDHQGTVRVEDRQPFGTTFVVELPQQ